MDVRILKRHEIDDKSWDRCVINSRNSLHYPMAWYLDIVSPEWAGIVYGNYTAVMPLPIKQKFGLKVVLQPFFCQQLGLFSSEKLSTELLNKFYQIFKSHHPVVYNINLFNPPKSSLGLKLNLMPNVELDLNKDYQDLKKAFSKNTRRNIVKAEKSGVKPEIIIPDDYMFEFFFKNLRFSYSPKEKDIFRSVVLHAIKREEGILKACRDTKGKLIAVGFFIIHKNRITFLGSSSSDEGYEKKAVFAIFENVIKAYSNKKFILDFEGSKNEGVARFYRGFGGKVIEYGEIKSSLHSILLLLKKLKSTWL